MELTKQSKILILGNSGKVGSQIQQALITKGYTNIQGSHDEDGVRRVNLINPLETKTFVESSNPNYIIICAGVEDCKQFGIPEYKPLLYNYQILLNVLMVVMYMGPIHLYFVDSGFFSNEALDDLFTECNHDPKNKSIYHYCRSAQTVTEIFQ